MSGGITFLAEGPTPAAVGELYAGGLSAGENYSGELGFMYRAGGYVLEAVALSWAPAEGLAEEARQLEEADGQKRFLGPVVDEKGLLVSGTARWCRANRETRELLSAA